VGFQAIRGLHVQQAKKGGLAVVRYANPKALLANRVSSEKWSRHNLHTIILAGRSALHTSFSCSLSAICDRISTSFTGSTPTGNGLLAMRIRERPNASLRRLRVAPNELRSLAQNECKLKVFNSSRGGDSTTPLSHLMVSAKWI
jgi:hypothetical protein